MTRGIVLLVTHRRDEFTIDRVAAAVAARGARPVRVDSDLFPRAIGLALSTHATSSSCLMRLADDDFDARDVVAVWLRKLWSPDLGDDLDPAHRQACEAETRATLAGFFDHLDAAGVRFVNHPERDAAAENKPKQLRLAAGAGLTVPDTCVTNDPDAVRRFHHAMNGRVIAKMLTPYTVSMDGSGEFVHTARIGDDDLDNLDGLSLAPMIFQREIHKREELRVAYVGGQFFVGSISVDDTDWRKGRPAQHPWTRGSLSPATQRGVERLMGDLGLSFGALDFIRTPDGEEVFLEVNPRGEWGMLEMSLDLPISAAIADALLATSRTDVAAARPGLG